MLSEMFGVDEAEIKAALDEMRASYEAAGGPAALDGYLDQAVQAGILTQEEADMIRHGRAGHEQLGSQVRDALVTVAHDLGKLRCPLVAEDVFQHHRFGHQAR